MSEDLNFVFDFLREREPYGSAAHYEKVFEKQFQRNIRRHRLQHPDNLPYQSDEPQNHVEDYRLSESPLSLPRQTDETQNDVKDYRLPDPPRSLPYQFDENQNDIEDYWLPEPPLTPPKASTNSPWAFLDHVPKGTATLTYNDANGNLLSIHDLNLDTIEERSPIIAAAFEHSHRHSQLHLDLLSPLAALPFIRFLYTGDYGDGQAYNDVPTSLLLHCQLFFFASVFDIPDLKSQALINVLRQCEFACSSPDKPIDLCAAIRFCYDHVDDNRRVIDEILEYCIERFANHKLGQDQGFRSLAFEHRPFYSDLAKTCRRRGFEDEAAIDIIRLPYDPQMPPAYASLVDTENPRFHNVVHHFHKNDESEERAYPSNKAGKRPLRTVTQQLLDKPYPVSNLTLALRGSRPVLESASSNVSTDTELVSASEDEGFQLVRPASAAESLTPLDSGFVVVLRPAADREVSERESVVSWEDTTAELYARKAAVSAARRDDDDVASSDSDWTSA